MTQVRIAVAGAGMIGKRHIEEIDASDSAVLAAIVDPGPSGSELAEKYGVSLHSSLADLFATDKPDGIILATPNQMHVAGGLECVAAGVPVLVEKPIGDDVPSATRLVEAGEKAGVPVLTGHHRNYSPIMAKAREIVQSGVLGTLVGVTGTALFYKPADYFDAGGGWRREPGGGPILLNLTHEVNNLLSLLGDIDTVIAMTSNSTRRFPVEDTAAMPTERSARSCCPTPRRRHAVGSRPPGRTPAMPAMPTRTRITLPEHRVRCRSPRCA